MVALITNGLNRMRTLRSFSYTPRWIVFLIDAFGYWRQLRCLFDLGQFQTDRMRQICLDRGPCYWEIAISFLLGHTYSGIVRFTGNGGCFAHLLRVDGRGDCPSFG